MIKRSKTLLAVSLLIAFCLGITVLKAESTSKLAKTEILGKEYFIYDVKKGESVYGIAKRYDWNLEELLRLNPDATGEMHKGMRLYYPTGQVSVVTEMPEPVSIDYSSLEPIRHKVKKGETIYSISRQYNIPLETIYKYNPSAKRGVKPGEILEMPQSGSAKYYYYTVKKGDTLSSIAQKYNTSVEDILKNNPGLSVSNMYEGETIRISINSNVGKVKTELVAEEQVSQISSYRVSKNETWDEISEKTGVEVEVLKEANDTEKNPKENTMVNVPLVETVEVEKTIAYEEPENLSVEEVKEMYDSIKGISPDERNFEGVRMAVLLDEPSAKKDVDFTRGILVALSEMKDSPYKIDMKVIDGRISSGNILDELEGYEPNLIISTADKTFPFFLADYGNTNNVQIINVFDLKNDLYEDNASMIQILQPSAYFNDRIATHIQRDNRRRKMLMVGEIDENDGIGSELKKLYEGNLEELSLEDFGNLEPDIMESYIVYSYASKKEDVSDFMKNIEALSESFPGFNYRVIGRSSWIAMLDDLGDQFNEYSVWVPSRIWLDEESSAWKNFEEKYETLFDGIPVRSIPNYAAAGYDIAQYFIPELAANKGDFNKDKVSKPVEILQNDISLTRVNNWGGFINGIGYIVKFSPDSKAERIIVK